MTAPAMAQDRGQDRRLVEPSYPSAASSRYEDSDARDARGASEEGSEP
ncbi:hypothetical protein ACFXC9_04135 [Streptomyces naganishii]